MVNRRTECQDHPMRTLAVLLAVLGGLFLLEAVVWGALAARARIRVLGQHIALLTAINDHNSRIPHIQGHETCQIAANELLSAVDADPNTWNTIATTRQIIERSILLKVLSDLRGPGALGAAGVLFATASAVVALYV
jgi:hypothetical protein